MVRILPYQMEKKILYDRKISMWWSATFELVQWRASQTALFPVYDVKWGHFEQAKMTLKMLPASWYLKYLFKGFRSFNTVNMGSVGQRASKLLAVKVGGLKKKSAIWPRPLSNQSAQVRLRPGSNLSQSLTDSNFAALWPIDPTQTLQLKHCAVQSMLQV